MRFALLGDHPDGLHMTLALAASGRHELSTYAGPTTGAASLREQGLACKSVGDLEEVLADPAIELVVVASKPAVRAEQLRRALQSERHVLCIHPADQSPDIAYEAAMIQADTRMVLLPLLPEVLHPAILRLAEILRSPEAPLGKVRLIQLEHWSTTSALEGADAPGQKPSFPGWDILRTLAGEVAEVSGLAASAEVMADEPVLLAGRFESNALFQATYVSQQPAPRWQLVVVGSTGSAILDAPQGWRSAASLRVNACSGERIEESWPGENVWSALVEVFEATVRFGTSATKPASWDWKPSWQDAVRCLELDDAARRSVERRRVDALEYQEMSEEVGFKGTMTLLGCALLWGSVLLLVLSRWVPWLGWLIVPVFAGFLGLQLLRWLVPTRESSKPKPPL